MKTKLEDYQKAKLRCFDFPELKDGEEKIIVFPGFTDMGNKNKPSEYYGNHSPEIHFITKHRGVIVSWSVMTGWYTDVPFLNYKPICCETVFHFSESTGDSCEVESSDCGFTKNGKCFFIAGSMLYAEQYIMPILHTEGSPGVFDKLREKVDHLLEDLEKNDKD